MYAGYEFYKDEYFGELVIETDYPKYELKARNELDYYTRMRIPYVKKETILNKVKMCQCKLIDLLYNYDQEVQKIKEYEDKSVEGIKASETVGKQSISYQKASLRSIEVVKNELQQDIFKTIQKDLAFTGLLYRGVYHVR